MSTEQAAAHLRQFIERLRWPVSQVERKRAAEALDILEGKEK